MSAPSKDTSFQQFPIIGIGASAGGLEAIKLFLRNVPVQSGMAFVYVQHLNPSHDSALAEILSRETKIPVAEITDDVLVEPDHFYIIPADKMLTVVDGRLKLDPRSQKTKKIKLIDLFFSSLGVVHQSFAVGIVLSGTLNDGTLGLQVIKAHGGMTFVQDDTAAYGGMPHNAIKAGAADFVLPPDQIAIKLQDINKPFHVAPTSTEAEHPLPEEEEESFRHILSVLRVKKKVDFRNYKQTTVIRRIQRRMALSSCEKPAEYLSLLRESTTEYETLFRDMLISVTEFFRDPRTFDAMGATIIPALLKNRLPAETIRIWVAGCATGEEAYSIAICFEEYFTLHPAARSKEPRKLQIFATDLSQVAIEKARAGIYTRADLNMVSPERLNRFFTKLDGNYQVNKAIRECCVFAQHNLLKDPPLSKMNLVTCRNLLIYLEPVLQKKALQTLHYSLKEKGILVLGKSETVGSATDLFIAFNGQEKIYSKKGSTGRFMYTASAGREQEMRDNDIQPPSAVQVADVNKKADEILLQRYMPPGVVVNDSLDIIQFRGDTSPWLAPQPGRASFNLMKMAREGLSFELRNLLHTARAKNSPVRKEGITMQVDGQQQMVALEAMPVDGGAEPHFMVLFQAQHLPSLKDSGSATLPDKSAAGALLRERIVSLEKELAQNREDMRTITEEQEATNEELQSANEELLSGSEELQALNEELETAKEELESTNEELTSLNEELSDRFEQANKLQLYSEGIFATIRDAMLVLDHDFKITKATAGFYKKFGVSQRQVEGKLLFELPGHQWNLPELKHYLENITGPNITFSDFEITQNFPHIGPRHLILNGRQLERVDGNKMILLAIEDVTDKRRAEQSLAALKISNNELKHTNLELEQFASIASHDLQEPLRKILTFINLMNERKVEVSDGAKPYLEKIAASANRMQLNIKDLLGYSKIVDAREAFRAVELTEVITNVLSDFELAIQEMNAQVDVAPLPAIKGNPLYMNQLFYNLISNALKFSKRDVPPRIQIYPAVPTSAEVAGHPNLHPMATYIAIVVQDNGIGFDQKYAEQVFTLFQRLHGPEEFSGTGIGLALCRKIVLQHGGAIYAQSKEGEGTTFRLLLPAL